MNLTIVFMLVVAWFLLALPRHLASIPIVISAACITGATIVDIGPASFTVIRILVIVGVLRVILRGESIAYGLADVDRFIILWAICLIATSAFHAAGAFVFRAGLVWDQLGSYLLLRVFLREWDDIIRVFRALCLILVPVSMLMLVEQSTGQNLFGVFGGSYEVTLRDGVLRARGPFAHPILAGTVGAALLPMAASLWREHRAHAVLGIGAAAAMIFSSRSSGPVLMAAFAVGGLLLWPVRHHMVTIRWFALLVVIALHLVMKAPVYFLIARVDVMGGSQGWHRAQLLHESLRHLDEWWLVGTDYTRHWMATGIYANTNHTDITNHFIYQGVHGGLPLVAVFVAMLVVAFRAVGRLLALRVHVPVQHRYTTWALGVTLTAHVANFLAIALFDQSIVFFYLLLAAIGVTRQPSHGDTGVHEALPRAARRRVLVTSAGAQSPAGSFLTVRNAL